jgi:hypothetical protein
MAQKPKFADANHSKGIQPEALGSNEEIIDFP